MPEFQTPSELLQEIRRLQEVAREWNHLFPQATSPGQHWLQVLSQVQAHVAEDVLRVAVVGTVKSGKSTLVNALAGQDLLQRGAGILTAMITRLQPATDSRAVLHFKDWDEINAEVNGALGLFPSARLASRSQPLALTEAGDRELLAQLLTEGESASYWVGGVLNQDYLLLKAYLEGYPQLSGYLARGGALHLSGPELLVHRELVTREAAAVYLKDVLLTVPTPYLPAGVELGDCQGSDSPVPQHLAQVLAYLWKSDLALYVVSSRVGLRQADFYFLAELHRMGLLPHLYFLVNLDLTEHRGLGEIQRLVERVRQELLPVLPEPSLYAFSALQLLWERRRQEGQELDSREAALLSVWAADPEAFDFSGAEAQRFTEDFPAVVQQLQTRRLSSGSLAQMHTVARGLTEQLTLAQEVLGRDLTAFQDMEQRLRQRRQPLEATLKSLQQTLKGTAATLKQAMKDRVSSYLDLRYGQAASVREFIQRCEPDWDQLQVQEGTEAFRLALYRLFQGVQKDLARFIATDFNLKTLEFLKNQEAWLSQELEQACAPLFLALQEALTLYYREIVTMGLPAGAPAWHLELPPPPAYLEAPLLDFHLEPGWRWAGEIWVRAGAGILRRTWQKLKARLGLKAVTDPAQQLRQELTRALGAIREWLLEQVKLQLLDYGERLKFRYFFPLVDFWVTRRESDLENLLGSLVADLEGLADTMQQAEQERDARRHRLQELLPLARQVEERLGVISLLRGGPGEQRSPALPQRDCHHDR